MGEALLTRRGGGVNINGVIQQYKVAAGNTITAGDFVQFINSLSLSAGTEQQVSTSSYQTTPAVSAVALSATSVFVAYANGLSNPSLYGRVITISGTTLTAGTDTQLSASSGSGGVIGAVALSATSVFVAHSSDSTSQYLYGRVVTISGTTITAGTDTSLSTGSGSGSIRISAAPLSSTSVFISHLNNSTNAMLYGIVVTISGTTITVGTDKQLNTAASSGYSNTSVALSATSVLVAHADTTGSTNYRLYGIVVTISGTTITAGTDTALSTVTGSGLAVSAASLSAKSVLIVHSMDYTYQYLYGMVVTISGTTLTAGGDRQLNTTISRGHVISAVALSATSAIIVHNDNAATYGMPVIISGTTITAGSDVTLSTSGAADPTTDVSRNSISIVALSATGALAAYRGSSGYFVAKVATLTNTITVALYSGSIGGVAKTGGAANATIDVYVPAT